jgi:hypothetical protein
LPCFGNISAQPIGGVAPGLSLIDVDLLRSFPCVVRGHVSSWCAAKPSFDNVNGSFLFCQHRQARRRYLTATASTILLSSSPSIAFLRAALAKVIPGDLALEN